MALGGNWRVSVGLLDFGRFRTRLGRFLDIHAALDGSAILDHHPRRNYVPDQGARLADFHAVHCAHIPLEGAVEDHFLRSDIGLYAAVRPDREVVLPQFDGSLYLTVDI